MFIEAVNLYRNSSAEEGLLRECMLNRGWLSCDPVDCGPPGSSVHGILQARILEWVANSFTISVPWVKGLKFPAWIVFSGSHIHKMLGTQSLHSCLTLCDAMDCSPPGSSNHGIFLGRILEWVAISSFRGSSWPRDQTCVSCVSCSVGRFFTTEPPWKYL